MDQSTDPDSNTTPVPPTQNSDGWENWCRIRQRLGERYWDCKLSNFQPSDVPEERDRQSVVVKKIGKYIKEMPARVAAGQNVVFFGPAGTGKDHLMSAMIQAATYGHNLTVEWINGMDLYAERRDAIHSDADEKSLIAKYAAPDVVAISDPLPPYGSLTEGQAEFLFRVLDRRYRARKAVWITANFANKEEAAERLGSQLVDRMRDGAMAIHLNWASYRQSARD